jgi:hypothetical protein
MIVTYYLTVSPIFKVHTVPISIIPNPGNNPPSKAPIIMRHATKPPKLCVMPVRVATTPQPVVMNESQRDGVNFLMTRLLGSSLAMYVTNKRETAIWNWFGLSPRSFSMP